MEQRIEDAEVKIAFLEHQLAELDGVVRELFARLARAEDELRRLTEKRTAEEESANEDPPPHWEKPPHY
jgi:uncharacterized coiled-coil protein SlyX